MQPSNNKKSEITTLQKSKEEILQGLKKIMGELFELDEQRITLETKLYEDLDLDSIDAVDLIVHLQSFTNKKFKPTEFKAVRTIGDVVEVIYTELEKNEHSPKQRQGVEQEAEQGTGQEQKEEHE